MSVLRSGVDQINVTRSPKGVVRDDLSPQDRQEAMATGCVRARLTPAQYQSCLDAQPVRL
jgi:hypothetical protein